MAGIVLSALGVIPLGLHIFEAHNAAKQKLRTIQDPDGAVKRARRRFNGQYRIFIEQWEILLGLIIEDKGLIHRMCNDLSYESWKDSDFNDQLHTILGETYNSILEVFKEISDSSDKIKLWLEAVAEEETGVSKDYKGKRPMYRLKDALRTTKVVFESDDLNNLLQVLTESVGDLVLLMSRINKTAPEEEQTKKAPEHLIERGLKLDCLQKLPEYRQTQEALATLHKALADVWICDGDKHLSHYIHLETETSVTPKEVFLNLTFVFDFLESLPNLPSKSQLKVQSTDISQPQLPSIGEVESFDSVDKSTASLTRRLRPLSLITRKDHSQKAADGVHRRKKGNLPPNLRDSKDLCSELIRSRPIPLSRFSNSTYAKKQCLGYLEARTATEGCDVRHTIYSRQQDPPGAITGCNRTTMAEMIDNIESETVDDIDKLRFARCIVQTVLKLHSTPWLGPAWTLNDLSMFIHDPENISSSINSLHISYDMANFEIRHPGGNPSDGLDGTDTTVQSDDDILRNIKNWSLYSLGVALLEIDRWQNMDPNDIVGIRRIQKRRSRISIPFGNLIQRCLECNFGYDCKDTLSCPLLQEAVCKYVIGEMNRQIFLLEKLNLVETEDAGYVH